MSRGLAGEGLCMATGMELQACLGGLSAALAALAVLAGQAGSGSRRNGDSVVPTWQDSPGAAGDSGAAFLVQGPGLGGHQECGC